MLYEIMIKVETEHWRPERPWLLIIHFFQASCPEIKI